MTVEKKTGLAIAEKNSKVQVKQFNMSCHRWYNGSTCPNCYALKSYNQYPNVRERWDANYKIVTENPELLVELINEKMKRYTFDAFRINTSGELTVPILKAWVKIAVNNPSVKFWTYTKEKSVVDYIKTITLPENLKVHGNTEINYGSLEAMIDKQKNNPEKYFICPCRKGNDKDMCGIKCTLCMTEDRLPLFIEH